jgi:predicted transposase YbfD/YdcC
VVMIRVQTWKIITVRTTPVGSSWLIECISRHFPSGAAAPDPVRFRESLARRVADLRGVNGIRHRLASLVAVAVAGTAAGLGGPLAIAQAAAGWGQDVLAAHGCRVCPRTGLRVAPSASTLGRLPAMIDPDGFEAALTVCVAEAALDPAVPAACAACRAEQQRSKEENRKNRKRKPPAADGFGEERGDGRFRPHPQHPWLSPAVCGDPGHVPARRGVAVDGKERKLAKAGQNKKVHLLAAITHVPGLVIAQDKVAKSGKASEITHFKPLLAPLPLDDVLITSDAMQANRANAAFLRTVKKAHYLWPVLGNQPGLNATLNALPWETAPVAAATSEISRGRIETRTIRVLPAPPDTGFQDAEQALLIERYTTYKKKGQWHTRAEAVLYLTSLAEDETTPEDLLAHVRGHWRVEHTHWLRDVIWKEDKSLIRTGNGPQVWSAITNLVITLFRIRGVTSFAAETRRIAQDPRRALRLLDITDLSPG